MGVQDHQNLSRRERQIMDIVYQKKEASAAQVLEDIPDPPSYTTVRTLLRLLENKGHLKHRQDGPRYIFYATVPREEAQESAMRKLLHTFFDGSTEKVVATLLGPDGGRLTDEELSRIADLVARARDEGVK